MIITNEAADYIRQMMEENEVHTLRLTHEGDEDGMPLWDITLEDAEEGDTVEDVNGIRVAIAKGVESVARDLKLEFEQEGETGTLVISGADDE